VTGEFIRNWVRQYEIDNGEREGLSTSEREELKYLRCETRIVKDEREIFKKQQPVIVNQKFPFGDF
jgi:transposase